MEVTSIQDYVRDIVLSKHLCSSMGVSGEWFPFAFLTGDNIIVYIACQKKAKALDLHVRWSTIEKNPGTSAAIAWGDSNRIDLQMPIGQSISKRTKQYVTRYSGKVKLDAFQDLLLSKQVTFVSGSVSEKLILYSEIDSLVFFLAHCVGHKQLPEVLSERLNQEYENSRRKEQEKKKKAEQARKKREEQKKKKEEEFQRQLEIRDIELRPDAKVLAKYIYDQYLIVDSIHYNSPYYQNYIHRPSAREDYLPQFMSESYLKEVEELICNRGILSNESWDWGHGRIVDSQLIKDAYGQIIPPDYLYDIIDKKTTAAEVIESIRLAAENLPKNKTRGCYIATCVYGSYDCPEVWTLRRFRDQFLRNSWLGRVFIKAYYATSPTLVKWFGGMEAFRAVNRRILDRWVNTLNNKGFENNPYEDL